MFNKTVFAAPLIAGALLAAGAAHARPVPAEGPVTATYRFSTKRFCVRAEDLGVAERTGTRIYRRQCLNQRQWRDRGITFFKPRRTPPLARS